MTVSFESSLFRSGYFVAFCCGVAAACVAGYALSFTGIIGQSQSGADTLSASSGATDTQSSGSGGQKITADAVMSGEYEVGPDGKLLRPEDPSVVLPPLPDAAKELSEEGAYAFGEYWLQVMAYSWNSGDIDALARLSDESCKLCTERLDKMRKLEKLGKWAKGMRYETKRLDEFVKVNDNLYGFWVEVNTPEHVFYDGHQVSHRSGRTDKLELQPCWQGDHWMMCGGVVF